MRVHNRCFGVLWLALWVATICSWPAHTKPMMQPSMNDAITSDAIVVATYQGHEPLSTVPYANNTGELYMRGLRATYIVQAILRTNSERMRLLAGEGINVRYLFHDLTPCLPDTSFAFSESLMPAKGSSWILFLNKPESGAPEFTTYRGEAGRLQASNAALQQVRTLLANSSDDPHHYKQQTTLDVTFNSDSDFKQLQNCTKLRTLNVTFPTAGAGLAVLRELPSLTDLQINAVNLTDHNAHYLGGLSHLRKLNIVGATKLTDNGLATIKGLNSLQYLQLSCPNVRGTALSTFSASPYLVDLLMYDGTPDDASIAAISKLSSLKRLLISHGDKLTDAAFDAVSKLANLRELNISSGTHLRGSGLNALTHSSNLRSLSLEQSGISSVSALAAPQLRSLNLTFCNLNDASLNALRVIPTLEELVVSNPGSPFTDAVLPHLAQFPSLRKLSLSFSKIDDEGVLKIAQSMPNLTSLSLHQTKITARALKYLGSMPHLKEVELTENNLPDTGVRSLMETINSRR